MKLIQRTPINGFRACCNILFFVCMLVGGAQSPPGWIEISLVDNNSYARFGTDHIYDNRYPPSACFDADVATCWVSGAGTGAASLYIRLPERDNLRLNLLAGYGKNEKLYEWNARPKSIRLSVLAAVNPDGFVSENATMYKTVRFSQTKTVDLVDICAVQSIPLDFSPQRLSEFKKNVLRQYEKDFDIPKADSCLILQLEIVDTRPGSRYGDICISEIYFNDCLLSTASAGGCPIEKVYLNREENELLLDDGENRGVRAYRDTAAVLQILDISPDKRWAIVISMPAEIEGRAETTFLLFDLLTRELMNARLEKQTGNYLSGNEMHIETGENGRVYLNYSGTGFNSHQIELR
jgi:hypothetical protein